ncbi:MAG: hypothetical protein AAFZ15_21245 [Bacteroidota bacterium]
MLSEILSAFNIKTRSSQLRELAEEMNIPYTRKTPFKNLPKAVRRFKIFRNKSSRRIRNVLSFQENDLPGQFKLFDFLHQNSSEERRRTTILLFRSDALNLPSFRVRPKNALHILGEIFVQPNIVFEGHPGFMEKYTVSGDNSEEIKYALKPEAIDFLTHKKNWNLEGFGPFLIIYRKGKRPRVNEILPFYRQGAQVCRWMLFSNTNDFV